MPKRYNHDNPSGYALSVAICAEKVVLQVFEGGEGEGSWRIRTTGHVIGRTLKA
jgi:hypothetical protein